MKRIGLFILLLCTQGFSAEIRKLPLPPAKEMTRADIYYSAIKEKPQAVLVLAPGYNGNGRYLIEDSTWQEFAKQHHLLLIGLSFASDVSDLKAGKGYYYASEGSGKILLKGIEKLTREELPILLYGFSGGAHFVSRFAEWQPGRTKAWCAYSAAWWDDPSPAESNPPGIVICGEKDERLGASLSYFQKGRSLGKPWLWITVTDNGHSPNLRAENFIRIYFSGILAYTSPISPGTDGAWVDIDTMAEVTTENDKKIPTSHAWLPSRKLLDPWRALNGIAQ